MKEKTGNITELKHYDAIVVPSHGYITISGDAFTVDGPALDVSLKWDSYRKYLGRMVMMHGSHVYMITSEKKDKVRLGHYRLKSHLVHFPIQPVGGISKEVNVQAKFRAQYKQGFPVPGWAMKVDMDLVTQSAKELVELAKARKWKKVAIAQPEVSDDTWKKIRKKLRKYLKDAKFYLILRPKKPKLPVPVEEPKIKEVRRKKHGARKHNKHK